jgi:sialate O-acetylesterase
MKNKIKATNLLLLIILLCNCALSFSQVRLPHLISDGMVLQRNAEVKIWGWAAPGESIVINFLGKSYNTIASLKGKWIVTLPSSEAGGPYVMDINASNHITIKDILIGDVWICSGQSNMEYSMNGLKDRCADAIANSNNPSIRQFYVPNRYTFQTAEEDVQSKWKPANPDNVLNFSAVAYFFARDLYEKYHVPIGLINASLGGSPAQSWMSEEALKEFPRYYKLAEKYKDTATITKIVTKDRAISKAWYAKLQKLDKGYAKGEKSWRDTSYDASSWKTMVVPGYWKEQGLDHENGVFWFRKEIDIPASMVGKPARLLLGRVVDADSVFINGRFVGTTSYQYPQRQYNIPANILKTGKNIIIVRVINNSGKGGFVSDKPYEILVDGQSIDLKGNWRFKLGAKMSPLPGSTFIQWQPTGLYKGMLAPLMNFTIKGVIWYQGESNAGKALEYQKLFPALIADWRKGWNQGNFPFLFVQLPNFTETHSEPSESHWAELRESQLKTLSVPNTGMAITIELGEWNDVHPPYKEDVGKRLSLVAQKIAYSDTSIVFSGPLFKSMTIEGNKIILTFTNTGSGLIAKGGGELKQFAIAGSNKKYSWAQAQIEGNHVIVWNNKIKKPVSVRYAWANNPEGANLYNKEGLPASPFRAGE